jgi:hypothetical protein
MAGIAASVGWLDRPKNPIMISTPRWTMVLSSLVPMLKLMPEAELGSPQARVLSGLFQIIMNTFSQVADKGSLRLIQ